MAVANEEAGREDPLVSFHFMIDVQGEIKGYFTEVSGLGSESEIIEQKVTTEKGIEIVKKIPGRLKWGDITLKRGITSSLDMWNWRRKVEEGKVGEARKNGSIVMFDQELGEKARWNFVNGWPTKISGPSPKSDSNEIGVEELTIAHELITRVT
ncbi:phage tail protein [Chloroflexota bacterium]